MSMEYRLLINVPFTCHQQMLLASIQSTILHHVFFMMSAEYDPEHQHHIIRVSLGYPLVATNIYTLGINGLVLDQTVVLLLFVVLMAPYATLFHQ